MVPRLDGADNPTKWTTINEFAPTTHDKDGQLIDSQDLSVHDANRYAGLADQQPTTSPALEHFFAGQITVHDYYAVRP